MRANVARTSQDQRIGARLVPTIPARGAGAGALAARILPWLAALALIGYAVFLATHTTVVAGGSDSSGYLNSARLLAAGKLHAEFRVPPEFGPLTTPASAHHFAPAGFNTFPGVPGLSPVYPTGLPLHFALAGRLFGWSAGPFLVQLGAALAAVSLCFATARALGFGFTLAATAAALLAAFPVFIFTSIQTLSDTLATAWVLGAVFCAVRGRASVAWAAGSGAALAMAVLVRPTNLLFAPALVVLLGFDLRRLGAFLLAGVPGAAWFAFYNRALYGGALQSGYGNIYADFGVAYAGPTAVHFAQWLARLLPALVLALPAVALLRRETRRRELFALLLGSGAITTLYLFYGISREVWWCLRFILPGVPLLLLAALYGLDALARFFGSVRAKITAGLAAALVLWAAGNAWHWVRELTVLYVPGYERAYAEAAQVARATIPANAIVVCSQTSGSLFYYTSLAPFIFDGIPPEEFARYAQLAREAGRPIYAVLFDIEENDVFQKNCPGAWTRLNTIGNIGIWKLP